MGTLDSLRTWADRHPDAPSNDWRVAQGNGWKTDAPALTPDAAAPVLDRVARAHTTNPRTVAAANRPAPLFIVVRPKADRLVYVLLRQLAEVNPTAADAGRTWYDANRETLTVDAGSNWITRIRAKIAAGPVDAPTADPTPIVPTPGPTPSAKGVWAEWRALATELAGHSGHPSGTRYAVDNAPGNDNDISFWWVSVSKTGYAKLRQVIGGVGPTEVRMSPAAMIALGNRIKDAGLHDAMVRYGREIGSCGHCGRTLTKKSSRDAGIGPKCATRHG